MKEVSDELAAGGDGGGVDPVFPVEPSTDVWWVVEGLSHGIEGAKDAGLKGDGVELEVVAEAEVVVDGALDEVSSVCGMVEEAALKEGVYEVGDAEVVCGPVLAECMDVGLGDGVWW